jgi:hypothetical protein
MTVAELNEITQSGHLVKQAGCLEILAMMTM